jgi:hypothetical protein
MKNLRPEVKIKGSGGLHDIFDNAIKGLFNITDEEYDFICENASDEEINTFLAAFGGLETEPTFTEKRKGLEIRNKYLEQYNKK